MLPPPPKKREKGKAWVLSAASGQASVGSVPADAPVVWNQGLQVAGTNVWLDAPRKHFMSIVSSAWVAGKLAGRVLCTPETAALARTRITGVPLVAAYGKPIHVGPVTVELVPAGTLLGGSQAFLTVRGRKILFAPAIRPEGTPTALPAAAPSCDVLVLGCEHLETPTNGHAKAPTSVQSRFEDALSAIGAAIEASLTAGRHPVVCAKSPGPAQDFIVAFGARWKLVAHRNIVADTKRYLALGAPIVSVARFDGRHGENQVLLWPAALGSNPGASLGGKKGSTPSQLEGYDRLSFAPAVPPAAVLDYVHRTSAKSVFLYGDNCHDLASLLKKSGIATSLLEAPGQTSFDVARGAAT